MERSSLYFLAPRQVALRWESLPLPAPGQVLVETQLSAISSGTELLFYRGQFPHDIALDENIPALQGEASYPLKYGYSLVGCVAAVGPQVDAEWQGRLVFAFHPHETHFLAEPAELLLIPAGIRLEDAVFLPNMETALNLVMDGAPLIGEQVVVFGQGIVGLLTTALLASFPLDSLVAVDLHSLRRQKSLEAGAHACLSPDELQALRQLQPGGADLVFEVSGAPEALDQAVAAAGFAGRVVIGSWYGQKAARLNLGGRFHRSRIRLVSSQVSSLDPQLSGRWTKARRFELAWKMLEIVQPSRWITQRFPFQQAGEAYALIDRHPASTIQVLLTYGRE
jgi:2-desacetyl-2-hydroxyethyl bacteriochlorophyllide A dehydrogenase